MPLQISARFKPPAQDACVNCKTPDNGIIVTLNCDGEEVSFPPYCLVCLFNLEISATLTETAPGVSKRIKRLSQKQERRNMEAIGGRVSKASGAMASDKSDGRLLDKVRVEAKFTFAKSYRLTRQVLNKIRGECQGTEEPAVQIDFNDRATGRVEDSWVVIPLHVWENYVNALDD